VLHAFPTGLDPLVALYLPGYHLYLILGIYSRSLKLCWRNEHPTFYTYTGVPPHPLIQYTRFTADPKKIEN
jgi:hypothetical protein